MFNFNLIFTYIFFYYSKLSYGTDIFCYSFNNAEIDSDNFLNGYLKKDYHIYMINTGHY